MQTRPLHGSTDIQELALSHHTQTTEKLIGDRALLVSPTLSALTLSAAGAPAAAELSGASGAAPPHVQGEPAPQGGTRRRGSSHLCRMTGAALSQGLRTSFRGSASPELTGKIRGAHTQILHLDGEPTLFVGPSKGCMTPPPKKVKNPCSGKQDTDKMGHRWWDSGADGVEEKGHQVMWEDGGTKGYPQLFSSFPQNCFYCHQCPG